MANTFRSIDRWVSMLKGKEIARREEMLVDRLSNRESHRHYYSRLRFFASRLRRATPSAIATLASLSLCVPPLLTHPASSALVETTALVNIVMYYKGNKMKSVSLSLSSLLFTDIRRSLPRSPQGFITYTDIVYVPSLFLRIESIRISASRMSDSELCACRMKSNSLGGFSSSLVRQGVENGPGVGLKR